MLCATVCKRAWNIARRDKPNIVHWINPFDKMELTYEPKPTRPVTHDELLRFVKAADEAGEGSLGTAAMIAYYWLQREEDIIGRLGWTDYRPVEAPDVARICHHKTRKLVDIPLCDEDGTVLWPELMARLDAVPRYGTLIVMRDQPDRRRKTHLPWREDYFRHRVAAIRAAAGLAFAVKFMGLRHDYATMVRGLRPADLDKSGVHPQVGELRVRDLLHEWVHHDRNHTRQLLNVQQERVYPNMGNSQKFVGE